MEQQDAASDLYWSKLEKIYVHNVYENISSKYDEFLNLNDQVKDKKRNCSLNNSFEHTPSLTKQFSEIGLNEYETFSNNNQKPTDKTKKKNGNLWPKIKDFLTKLEPGSFIADIGCGEGKYLNVNSTVFSIGCDRSSSLGHLALSNYVYMVPLYTPNQILICDNLAIPFRSNIFDYVISIGVLHHLSTQKRRIKATQELVRILKPGGRILIYVWAMEQKKRKFKSQDVLIPMLLTEKSIETKCEEKRFEDSNNFEENSEDSPEEKLNEINFQKKVSLKTETQEEFQKENSSNSVEIDNESLILSKEDISIKKEDKSNLIESFKKYLKRKFSSKDLDLSEKSKEFFETARENEKFVKSSLKNQDSIDSYKNILENFKDILPEDFDLRKFPSSSCSNTFEANDEVIKTNKTLDCNSLPSTSVSTSSSIAQVNQGVSLNFEKSNDLDESNSAEESKSSKNIPEAEIDDSINRSNKRFYHVFKKNELDTLIRENCSDLIIYDSYYDHGNWCIYAQKLA